MLTGPIKQPVDELWAPRAVAKHIERGRHRRAAPNRLDQDLDSPPAIIGHAACYALAASVNDPSHARSDFFPLVITSTSNGPSQSSRPDA